MSQNRVAKTHRMPYLIGHFPKKSPRISGVLANKTRPSTILPPPYSLACVEGVRFYSLALPECKSETVRFHMYVYIYIYCVDVLESRPSSLRVSPFQSARAGL